MDRGDATACVRLIDQYCQVLERLADDPNTGEPDRAAAKEMLENLERMARATAQENLRVLSQIANDPHVDTDVRADAAKYLAQAPERIPPASDKRH